MTIDDVVNQNVRACLVEIERRLQLKFTENQVKTVSESSSKHQLGNNLLVANRRLNL